MDKNSVQSVERTFSIIEALSQAPKGAFLSELSTATALNKTTVHRLLSSLIMMGYAAKDFDTGRYLLTIKMYEVGSRALRRLDMLTTAKPYLEKLSNVTGEAVHLVIRDGNDIVYIFKEDKGNNSVRMSSRVGLRSPMYCTAVGKAILAELPEEEIESIWKTSDITPHTEKTITSFTLLKKQLKTIREKGYAVDDEENERGVRCVGASILDFSGVVAGAFSVSVPVSRMDDNRLKDIAELVTETKKEICSLMGCSID